MRVNRPCLGDTEYRIKDKAVYCQYAKQGADVVMLPL